MTSEIRNVSDISQLPKAGKLSTCRTYHIQKTRYNNPSEIQSAACGVDRKIIVAGN